VLLEINWKRSTHVFALAHPSQMLAAQNSRLLIAGSSVAPLAQADLLAAILLQEVTDVAHKRQTLPFLKAN
jgi:hypothetical protein